MIAGDEKKRSFALKQMKKSQIVETRQQQHIMSEKVGPITYNIIFAISFNSKL